ncbi:glycosyltransferase family 39 protein [Flavihumibacter fluvii]|uniref:glycosyltransferase family 39 protein n=1 Tax=Flavihumibacter fluvii TaxID=2838157 RepID=UPI001BDDD7DE|nr:glycosyltransferase family 39 protein [Flavihumibacter fluvii]ULQ52673.1 glycosyltransferase family 39 protein [Flavihumibacter fluvii]
MKVNRSFILAGFILVKFILQYYLISPDYDLQRDEYLHLDQGNHLAWGYLSVPPVTSWISRIIQLLGNTVFWVKFFPALFGALTIVIIWKAIEALKGNLFALILGATCILFSSLLRLNTLYQPNSLDVLSWTTFYYMLIRYIHSEQPKWLYFGAIIFAIGFLNKYNIAFLVLGLIPAILLTEHRRILTQQNFYGAVLLGLVLVSPNLIWQYQNSFPVLHHMQELAATQLVHVNRWDFFKDQILFFLGALFVIFASLHALLFYPPFIKYRCFFWALAFTLLVFVYFKAKSYYAIGLYPIYISFGAVFLGNLLNTGWKKYVQPVTIAIPLLFFIPLYKIAFPNKSPEQIRNNSQPYKDLGLLRWEDGKDHELPQDFADMLGWKQLADKVDSVCSSLPNLDHTLILCDNYGQAGAINYYMRNRKIRANSFNADYINWLPLQQKITDAILVKEDNDEDKGRKTEIPLFDTVYLAAKRINALAREPEISIYVLRGAKVDINQRIIDEMERKKNWQ